MVCCKMRLHGRLSEDWDGMGQISDQRSASEALTLRFAPHGGLRLGVSQGHSEGEKWQQTMQQPFSTVE
jgi:hypothetical protein